MTRLSPADLSPEVLARLTPRQRKAIGRPLPEDGAAPAAEVLHLRVVVPGLRLRGGLNARLHWRARAREVRAERAAVRQVLPDVRVPMPATVQIVRVAPSAGVDDDNLAGCCKAVRDEVAAWLGVDDGPTGPVTWTVAQRRGPWAVEIEIHHGGVG